MTVLPNDDVWRSLDTLFYAHYLEQLSSDMTHILYDLFLLSLLAEGTLAERSLRMLRGRVLNVPLGPDIAKRLITIDELWGRKLLQRGADFEAWVAERERDRHH